MHELEEWDGFDLLIGYPFEIISEVITDNKDLITPLKSIYLQPFALPFTRDWKITVNTLAVTWDNLGANLPTLEKNYNHLIANFSGLMMLCLIHPNTKQELAKYTDGTTFRKALENPETPIQYMTVPIRPSHVFYIPYGWYFYIYCGQENSNCVYMDLINTTWFN